VSLTDKDTGDAGQDDTGTALATIDDATAALLKRIKAHVEKGDRARALVDQHSAKADQHDMSVGLLLKQLKEMHRDNWQFLAREHAGVGRSRAYALIAIADGRADPGEQRASNAEANRQLRARKSSITHTRDGQCGAAPGEDEPGGSPGFDAACARAARLGREVRRFGDGYQLSDPDNGNGPTHFSSLGKLDACLKEISKDTPTGGEETKVEKPIDLVTVPPVAGNDVDNDESAGDARAAHAARELTAVNPAIAAWNATIAALNTLTDEQRVEFDRYTAGLKKPHKALAALLDPARTVTPALVTKAINLLPVDIFTKGFNDAADLKTRIDEADAAEKLKSSTYSQPTLIQNGNGAAAISA
jgi:hypothetical protein